MGLCDVFVGQSSGARKRTRVGEAPNTVDTYPSVVAFAYPYRLRDG